MPSNNINWSEVNETLVRRGELYIDLDLVENWDIELKSMNERKRGRPFEYPEQFIRFLAGVHYIMHIPYRQLQGFVRGLAKWIPKIGDPHYTHIRRRIMALDLDLLVPEEIDPDEPVVVAVDSTGLKVTNRGDWMRKMWKGKRKGWLKVHIAVNIRDNKVLAVEVTRDGVGDARKFIQLVASSCRKKKVVKVLGDGGYDARYCYDELEKRGIEPAISMRKDACTRNLGYTTMRSKCVRERRRLGGQEGWKRANRYGARWTVESGFSSFKNLYGESVTAKTYWNMVREVKTKFGLLNRLITMP